jgi:hypothetical protein
MAPDVVMADDVYEEDCAPLLTKHDAVAATGPCLEIMLVRKDGFHVEAWSFSPLDQSHHGPITGGLAFRG